MGKDRLTTEHTMKTQTLALLTVSAFLPLFNSSATIYVPSPPGDIVQNGSFLNYSFADWTWNGSAAIAGNPNAPNGIFAVPTDIYQVLPTTAGQQYALTFYMAADLYFNPSVTVDVLLNGQTLDSITTPPYTYNPGVNRDDQMRWQDYTYQFTASQSSTRLEFNDVTTYDFGLAAVSVVPMPEPSATALLGVGILTAAVVRCKGRRRGTGMGLPGRPGIL